MAKKKKRPYDVNVIASQIVSDATTEEPTPKLTKEKNPAAVTLGHLGGLKGGPSRAKKLSKKRLKEIAQKAAKARWSKKS
jgi:hypothetical protein